MAAVSADSRGLSGVAALSQREIEWSLGQVWSPAGLDIAVYRRKYVRCAGRRIEPKETVVKRNALIPTLSAAWLVLLTSSMGAASADSSSLAAGIETSHYGLDFWHEAQGLLSNRIRDMVQTRDGYLWLGTDGGLVRFDGVSFTTFGARDGCLRYDEVWTLHEDREGTLWIGTFGGGITSLKGGRFTTLTSVDGLPDDAVRLIDSDEAGDIWIATSHGAARYSHGRFTKFTRNDGLSADFVIGLCASSSQGIYAIAANKLHRFVGGKFVVVDGVVEKSDDRMWSLSSGRDGSLWIYFEGGVVKKLKDSTLTRYPLSDKTDTRAGRIYEDPEGTVWLGTRNGLRRLVNGRFEFFPSREARDSLGMVSSICADREGSLWLGLEANGLARLTRTQFSTLDDRGLLSNSAVWSVFQGRSGNIWVGTTIGVAEFSAKGTRLFADLDGSPIRPVTSIAEDAHGDLWIGAGGQLLHLKNGVLSRDMRWQRTNDIKTIYRDPKGRMWLAPDGDGLIRFDEDGMTAYRTEDGLPSNQVRGLLTDRQGALWIATFGGGVARLADGRFTTYTVKDGLGSNRVVAVYEDDSGVLWFATRGGLSRFKAGHFSNYTIQDGLPTNQISGILEDQKGNLWFSCSQGISRVSLAELNAFAEGGIRRLTSYTYGVRDGIRSMTSVAGYQPNSWRTTDGRLLFGSLKGLTVVDPGRLSSNTLIPPVYLEKLLINKKPHNPGGEVVIPPGEGEVEIHYTALSYLAPEKVRFKYRLEGFDNDWVAAGTRRFAYYASLSPGRYRFRVIACNNDGIWNESGASFAFYLKPHFYQTGWFYLLCVLAIALVAGGAFRLRIRQLEANEKDLQNRVSEALAKVKVLSGMLPICSYCKKVRDDKGYWNQIESYIDEHSNATFTHGMCPDCVRVFYPELVDEEHRQGSP